MTGLELMAVIDLIPAVRWRT